MSTALDLIQGALRKIGQYAPGETLSAADANDALDTLNALIDIWSNEHLAIFNNVENVLTLTPGKLSYTVGTGGEFNIPRPLRITNAYTRITNSGSAIDFQCKEIATDQYTGIGLKNQPGPWPKVAYYNTGFPLATLYLWPVPSQAGEFHMWTDMVLTTLALTDTLTMPQGYYLGLMFNLAVMLAPEYGVDPSETTKRAASSMKKTLKSTNMQPQDIVSYDGGVLSGGQIHDAGWILTGGF